MLCTKQPRVLERGQRTAGDRTDSGDRFYNNNTRDFGSWNRNREAENPRRSDPSRTATCIVRTRADSSYQ